MTMPIESAMTITGEYATGMIRASFTAVPKRLPVLWAKIAVFAAVSFVLMLPSVLIAFWVSQSILHSIPQLQTSLSAPDVLRTVFGTGLYLTGADICTAGVGGALMGGVLTASVVGKKNLLPAVLGALPRRA